MRVNNSSCMSLPRLLLVLYILLFSQGIKAQVNIDMIKSDPGYWWAEGKGITIDEANKDALTQIIQQISVSISSDTRDTYNVHQSADGKESIDYKMDDQITVSSFASLQNVKMMVLQPEPDAVVFRWVAKEEVKKMLDVRKQKVLDYVQAGKVAEQRIQIDDALRYYYWALLLARSLDEPITCEFNGEKSNCVTFLPLKIKSVMSQIEARVTDCVEEDNRCYMNMRFTYNGRNVSSMQMRYFDGQSYVGPLVVKDGEGVLDLLSRPEDNTVTINYEYMFRTEAKDIDPELNSMFTSGNIPTFKNSFSKVSIEEKTKKKKKKHRDNGYTSDAMVMQSDTQAGCVMPEPMTNHERIELETVINPGDYVETLSKVEQAIYNKKPRMAYECFTPEGYKMFDALINNTGTVSLVGKNQRYELVRANDQVLARFCKVKIKCRGGKIFMENIVFRFNEQTKKIQSLAFALTKKAEDDILNAESSWTNLSRFIIIQFMEDYQTAYSLKRLDYLEQIFSDKAVIITGTVLKTVDNNPHAIDGQYVNLGGADDVKYVRKTKSEYIATLKKHFAEREYIHLTFEDNISRVIDAPRLPMGTAFGIQINQIYTSPVYSDKGYLTLVLDTSCEQPMIYVRLWQPEKSDMMDLNTFISKFEF